MNRFLHIVSIDSGIVSYFPASAPIMGNTKYYHMMVAKVPSANMRGRFLE
jgi:hypothetical protein